MKPWSEISFRFLEHNYQVSSIYLEMCSRSRILKLIFWLIAVKVCVHNLIVCIFEISKCYNLG